MSKRIACKSPTGEEYSVDLNSLKWRPSVYAIIIENSSVLLVPQFEGRYGLPGGGINLGEKIEDAVIREVKEETGLNVENPKLVGCENSFFKMHNSDAYHTILLYYSCNILDGHLSIDGFDSDEKKFAKLAKWISIDDLENIMLASTVDFRKYIVKTLRDNEDFRD